MYDGLTDAEKALVDAEAAEKLNNLLEQLKENENPDDTTPDDGQPDDNEPDDGQTDDGPAPGTRDIDNIALWITLMISAVTALSGTTLYRRKYGR